VVMPRYSCLGAAALRKEAAMSDLATAVIAPASWLCCGGRGAPYRAIRILIPCIAVPSSPVTPDRSSGLLGPNSWHSLWPVISLRRGAYTFETENGCRS